MPPISQQQLESYLWGAATLLRGTIDAGDYKQFIFPLLFYKRLCDVFDEETQNALKESLGDSDYASGAEQHRFQVPAEAHWGEVRQAAKNVGAKLHSAMREIETANPEKLYSIFGDAQWTNKERLSDAMLRDLIEHFSTLHLTLENLPEDELGQGYEYLIKKFADDSGHTAAEFYTNRTVVHLMTEMLKPQPGESIYDPTCGSGGMLLSAVTHLRAEKKEWRNVRLYGQERNLMTSSIARMNCFLHGIEDFRIERGDTLSEPKLVEGDRLMRFDVVLANPPYSIKQWDREAFASDPWGRNLYGTPPQGRADYAFWQHIICSLSEEKGRCAILFPHGVLFRQEEAEMRRQLISADLIECVLGLGPNLFYNSPMEACVLICRTSKPWGRKGRVLFINAVNEVTRERAHSSLTKKHIARIVRAYEQFTDEPGVAGVATLEEIGIKDGSLSIPLYVPVESKVSALTDIAVSDPRVALEDWLANTAEVATAIGELLPNARGAHPYRPPETNREWANLDLFDRKNCALVKFGDIAQQINETERNPAEAGIRRFVGLEHLVPGSLHVRNWGNVSDGTTFTRRCRPGQVLLGKRRAYQRKIAVAGFDAVVSGDIYVLEPKGDRLLTSLLPFLCMSDEFFEHAVGTSAGSLSPRTNWTSLAKFEFALPDWEKQLRIAEMLDAASEAVTKRERVLSDLAIAREASFGSLFSGDQVKGPRTPIASWGIGRVAHISDLPTTWRIARLTTVARLESGHTPSRRVPGYWGGAVPWISLHDTKSLNRRCIDSTEQMTTELGIENSSARLLPAGTVVFCRTASVGLCSIMGREMSTSQDFANFVCGPEILPEYLYHLFRWMKPVWTSVMGGSTHQTIYMPDFQKLEVILPPVAEQRSIAAVASLYEDLISALRGQVEMDRRLLIALINCLLGSGERRSDVLY